MRVGKVTVNGKSYPIVFSTAVAVAVEKRTGHGAIEGLQSILGSNKLEDLFWLLSEMVKAGCLYMRITGGEAPEVSLTEEALLALTSPEEYKDLFEEMGEVASGGVRPEVTVESDPNSKNSQASPGV